MPKFVLSASKLRACVQIFGISTESLNKDLLCSIVFYHFLWLSITGDLPSTLQTVSGYQPSKIAHQREIFQSIRGRYQATSSTKTPLCFHFAYITTENVISINSITCVLMNIFNVSIHLKIYSRCIKGPFFFHCILLSW